MKDYVVFSELLGFPGTLFPHTNRELGCMSPFKTKEAAVSYCRERLKGTFAGFGGNVVAMHVVGKEGCFKIIM